MHKTFVVGAVAALSLAACLKQENASRAAPAADAVPAPAAALAFLIRAAALLAPIAGLAGFAWWVARRRRSGKATRGAP